MPRYKWTPRLWRCSTEPFHQEWKLMYSSSWNDQHDQLLCGKYRKVMNLSHGRRNNKKKQMWTLVDLPGFWSQLVVLVIDTLWKSQCGNSDGSWDHRRISCKSKSTICAGGFSIKCLIARGRNWCIAYFQSTFLGRRATWDSQPTGLWWVEWNGSSQDWESTTVNPTMSIIVSSKIQHCWRQNVEQRSNISRLHPACSVRLISLCPPFFDINLLYSPTQTQWLATKPIDVNPEW